MTKWKYGRGSCATRRPVRFYVGSLLDQHWLGAKQVNTRDNELLNSRITQFSGSLHGRSSYAAGFDEAVPVLSLGRFAEHGIRVNCVARSCLDALQTSGGQSDKKIPRIELRDWRGIRSNRRAGDFIEGSITRFS